MFPLERSLLHYYSFAHVSTEDHIGVLDLMSTDLHNALNFFDSLSFQMWK